MQRVKDKVIIVTGAFLYTKRVIPYLFKNRQGSIINISSIDGIVGEPDFPPYHASKAAISFFTCN